MNCTAKLELAVAVNSNGGLGTVWSNSFLKMDFARLPANKQRRK